MAGALSLSERAGSERAVNDGSAENGQTAKANSTFLEERDTSGFRSRLCYLPALHVRQSNLLSETYFFI